MADRRVQLLASALVRTEPPTGLRTHRWCKCVDRFWSLLGSDDLCGRDAVQRAPVPGNRRYRQDRLSV